MFYFTPGDKVILFVDSHGKTRLAPPATPGKTFKLKTNRKIRAIDGPVDLWLDEGVNPAGGLPPERTNPRALAMWTNENLDTSEAPAESKALEPLSLWSTCDVGYHQWTASPRAPRIEPKSGAWALIAPRHWRWELSFGFGDKERWHRPITLHGGHPHQLYPHAKGVVLTSLAPREGKVFAAFFDEEGALLDTFASTGLREPVYAHGRLAWQRDEDTIILREGGKEQAFSLTASTTRAHSLKKHPRVIDANGDWLEGLENTGKGDILLGEKALLFLPWHGETILDLMAQNEMHRKLPPEEHPVRLAYGRRIQGATPFARSADIDLRGVSLEITSKPKKNQYLYQDGYRWTRGEGGLVGFLVSTALLDHLRAQGPAKVGLWSSNGSRHSHTSHLNTVGEEADVLRAFALFDQHNAPLSIEWELHQLYESRLAESAREEIVYGELGRPMSQAALKLLVLACQERRMAVKKGKSEKAAPLMKRVEAWRKAQFQPDEHTSWALQQALLEDGPWRTA